jgi:hypothetical protein
VFDKAVITPSAQRGAATERAWAHLVTSGPTLFSSERIGVIRDARRAWQGAAVPNPESGMLGEATHWLAVDAEGITADLVSDFEARGLDRFRYLEVVGIVGLLSNIDWYLRGIGAPLPDLPDADDTSPSGRIDRDARITDSWVPMLTDAMAPHVLDALTDEGEALRDLHQPMYIAMRDIGNWTKGEVLSRVQIEYIAARTSYLNECFY